MNAIADKIVELAEAGMLREFPQVECPVVHHFGPGIYIREVFMPAGTFAVGHAQRFEHLNIMLKGKVAILHEGKVAIISAPAIFIGKPGRKIGYVLEDTAWQNVYATEERDVEKLEAYFIDKSQTFSSYDESVFSLEQAMRQPDRDDFDKLLQEESITAEEVRAQSEDESDQAQEGCANVTVRRSAIEGRGVFLDAGIGAGSFIAFGRIGGKRTPVGRYANHSYRPNAAFEKLPNGDIVLVALKDIAGCHGGARGDEVTVNYRQALATNRSAT